MPYNPPTFRVQPSATPPLFSISIDLPVLEMSHTQNHTLLVFHDWLLSLGIMCSRFIHVIVCVRASFLLYDGIMLHYVNVAHLVYPCMR